MPPRHKNWRGNFVALPGLCILGCLAACLRAEDWPRWLGPRGDSTFVEEGIVRTLPSAGLPVSWRTPIGAGYSGPAVADGRVFITDRPTAGGDFTGTNKAVDRSTTTGRERVLCLSESDGSMLWKFEYECPYNISYASGPRAMPTVHGNRVYTLGAEGHLHCLDTKSGRMVWTRNFKRDFGVTTQLWGFAAAPVVVDDLVVCLVGGPGQTAVAFDRETGAERWRALSSKEPGYSTPALWQTRKGIQLVIWDPAAVSGLDPKTGRVAWSVPFPLKLSHSIITPRIVGGHLFVSGFFNGSLLLRLDSAGESATEVWRVQGPSETKTQGLHTVMSPPWLEDGHIYGVCSYGQLRALRLETGERVWESLAATTPDSKPARWCSAFMVRHRDRFLILNEKGDLISARLSPSGYHEESRTHLIDPSNKAGGRPVVWSHPAYANGHILARNDRELIRADLRGDYR